MTLPSAFCHRMADLLGDRYADFIASYADPPAKGLRINPNYCPALCWRLGALRPIPYEPFGFYCDDGWGALPWHAAGAYYLQDPSAMLVANAIDFVGTETALDLCAAPGGKSTQLAARLPYGTLVCNEIDLGRAKTLLGNIERLGITNAIVTNLTPQAVAQQWAGRFDVVVVDAPCSGEGMFRKNPAAVDEWSEANVAMCAARQRDILDCAVRCLKPDGRLIYSTCTFSPLENEENVRYLTDTYPLYLAPTTPRVQAATVEGLLPHTRRFYPHLGLGEGHFLALLSSTSSPTSLGDEHPSPDNTALPYPPDDAQAASLDNTPTSLDNTPYYTKDVAPRQVCDIARDFLSKHLLSIPQGTLHQVGENLLLYAGTLPLPTRGLLCAGIKVGSIVKGRLTPHHMLFQCAPARIRLSLPADDPRVAAYLHGDSIPLDAGQQLSNGWGVLCVDDIPLGLFKNVDGTLKNHYPKGLRT